MRILDLSDATAPRAAYGRGRARGRAGRAWFWVVALSLWTLAARAGLAQDQELDSLLGDQSPNAGTESPSPAEAPAPGSEPQAAETEAAPEGSGASRGRVIEEIVVTAQRRAEQLHDVPISMSALDADFMRQEGITDLQDVARHVPNVRIDLAGGAFILPRVRGIGFSTIVNRGNEQPVGLVIDEVPYGRQDYFPSGLFDLGRLEVLRGPQGQLFGANTTVGLLNLTTKNPTDELTGSIDLELGELDRRRVEAGVGGPLLPGFLNFRIAGVTDERDGYIRNTTAEVVPEAERLLAGRDRQAVRLKLDCPNLFGGSLLLSYQRDDLEISGATTQELTSVPERLRPLLREYDPNADIEAGNLVASMDVPGSLRVNIDTLVARGHYDLAGWDLNTVVGFSRLDSSLSTESDFAPWPAIKTAVSELSRQTTVELRVTSPDFLGFFGLGTLFGRPLGSTDLTSGFFFQRREQSPTTARIDLNGPLVLATAVSPLFLGGADTPPLPGGDSGIPLPTEYTEYGLGRFEQDSRAFAGFAQMNWRFTERWALLSGMRLDYTTKDAFWSQVIEPDSAFVFEGGVGWADDFEGGESRDEIQFAPKVGMKFDWTDELNFYWTWSTGFQAGGFNNFGVDQDPSHRRFEPAHVRSWEAGTKARLLGGTAELNLGLFRMNMEDFQLWTQVPQGVLSQARVVNAGELLAQGVEADLTWLPTDWLALRGALGFNDSEFLDFPIGTCVSDRANTDGDEDARCDLTGGPLVQAPKWDVSMTPSVRLPLTSIPGLGSLLPSSLGGIDLRSALTGEYVDTHFLHDSLDPRSRQPSFFKFHAGIGFGNASQGWSLQVRGENLTDEATHNYGVESYPTAMITKSPDSPRLLFGSLHWEF